MAAGHFMMTFEPLFYPALVCIALGNGLFLPSLPSQIGELYRREDPRRGYAYNVYYVGVNLGAFLAPLICGTLGELYGWHYGFGAAGVGMLAGLAIYIFGRRHLPPEPLLAKRAAVAAPPDESRARLFLLLAAIGCAVVVFRGAYEQIGNTLALWADTGIDRTVGSGISIPMTWFQSLNPLLVFVLTPFLLAHWSRLSKRGREPRPLTKMALGAAGVALSYVMIAVVAATAAGSPAGWLWLAAFIGLLTASELYILPVGLGLFARLAPAGMAATMIAAWFFAAFAGNLLAGLLGTLWSRLTPAHFFGFMAAVAGGASLIFWVLSRFGRQAR
jgi:POT family proton-dependent oligopeptide transporter